MTPRRSCKPEEAASMFAALVDGKSASEIAVIHGTTRNAVLGLCLRHRKATGAAPVGRDNRPGGRKDNGSKKLRVRTSKLPRTPSPAAPTMVIPKPGAILLDLRQPVRATPRMHCEAQTLDGICGRPVCIDGRCLGHRWMSLRPGERLRPPAPRVTSTMAVADHVDRNTTSFVDAVGRERMPGRWRNDSELARKAAKFGWRRLNLDTWMRRAA